MTHRLLLAGGLGMKVDEDGIGAPSQWAGFDLSCDSAERTIDIRHEHAAHGIHDQDLTAIRRLE